MSSAPAPSGYKVNISLTVAVPITFELVSGEPGDTVAADLTKSVETAISHGVFGPGLHMLETLKPGSAEWRIKAIGQMPPGHAKTVITNAS